MPSVLQSIAFVGLRSFDSTTPVTVKFGALTVLVGPNGAGKSTVLAACSEALDVVSAKGVATLAPRLVGMFEGVTLTFDTSELPSPPEPFAAFLGSEPRSLSLTYLVHKGLVALFALTPTEGPGVRVSQRAAGDDPVLANAKASLEQKKAAVEAAVADRPK